MSIITLTSDFGLKDYFVAAAKARLFSLAPEAKVIDISHDVDAFNIAEAAYLIHGAFSHFPENTVHLILVDYERNREQQHVLVRYANQYFIAADNGILSLLLGNNAVAEIYEINIHEALAEQSDLQTLLHVAAHLAKNGAVSVVAKPKEKLADTVAPEATLVANGTEIHGSAIYFDRFGNIVTNIRKRFFDSFAKARSFEISLPRATVSGIGSISRIVENYSDIASDERFKIIEYSSQPLAMFNDAGFLEIAVFRGNPQRSGAAQSLLGVKYLDPVVITFKS